MLHSTPPTGLSSTPPLLRSCPLSGQRWLPCPRPATIPWVGCFAQAWNYPNLLKYTAANEDTGKKAIIVTVTHGARPDTSLIAC